MTHPDDEISICAFIRRLTAQGHEVYMSWTHTTPVREKEGRMAAARLGVPDENLFAFGATDGKVCDEMVSLLPRFEKMMNDVAPDRVCCGAFEQGHIDHDSTNLLVHLSFTGPIFEIPFYHPYTTRLQTMNAFSEPEKVHEELRLEPEEVRFKKDFAKLFPSQNIWSVLFWYEAYQITQLKRPELARRELMRLQTHKDFLAPQLPPKLAARVGASQKWAHWQKCAQQVLEVSGTLLQDV